VGIHQEDVDRVRAATDLIAVASEHLALKRVGRNYSGLCPFHSEKTPSFSISPEKGLFYCYGCGAKGDAITFVRDVERLDFTAAVERLAAKANITLRYDTDSGGRERARRAVLHDAMNQAVAWYHDRLRSAPDAGAARRYLRSRGYDRAAIDQFRIGWAPEGWDTLCKSLKLPTDVARDTGLGYLSKIGKVNDFFQSRILFPIFDPSGQPIAFGGRKLPDADGPKYKNSSETRLYSKSRTLYGLNWAKTGIVTAGEVIVCEGYTDVIAFHRAGLARAVATCGTALADEHFRILKNYARRIVLAYDADAAGQNAAEKFYAWERQFEIDLVVVSLPQGADPADVAREHPDQLADAVANARPFLQFRVDRLLTPAALATPEGRARAYEAAAAAVLEHPSPLVREQYLRDVAARCQVSEETMARTLSGELKLPAARKDAKGDERNNAGRRRSSPSPSSSSPSSSSPSSSSPTSSRRPERHGEGPGGWSRPSAERPEAGGSRARGASSGGSDERPEPDGRAVANSDPGYDADDPQFRNLRPADRSAQRATSPSSGSGSGRSRGGRASSISTREAAASERAFRAEREALRWVLTEPVAVLPWLDAGFFSEPVHARAFTLLVEHGDVVAAADAVNAAHASHDEATDATIDDASDDATDETTDEIGRGDGAAWSVGRESGAAHRRPSDAADRIDRGHDPTAPGGRNGTDGGRGGRNGRSEAPDEISAAALSLLHQLAVEEPTTEVDDAVAQLVRNTAERVVGRITRMAMAGDTRYNQHIATLKTLLEGIHAPQRRAGALGQLVPWLSAWVRQESSGTVAPKN
jgi:DNA primase